MKIYTIIEVNHQPSNITIKVPEDEHPIIYILKHRTLLNLTPNTKIQNLKLHRGTKLKGRPIIQYHGSKQRK